MITARDVRGVIPAIVTPFTSDDRVDTEALTAISRFLLGQGVHAIMTTGGTGEFCSLSREERRLVHQTVAQEVRGRIPVIAGTAACSTREALLLTQDAADAGADAAILTPPYYFRLTEQSLFEYYRDLSAGSTLPIVVYNNPLYTGNNLTPGLIARLADLDGIVGLKQSNSDLGQLVEIVRLVGDRISVCTGIDSQFLGCLSVGARGIFSTAACVIPAEMLEIYRAFEAGNHTEARRVHQRVQILNRFLEYDPGYVGPCKYALGLLGHPAGPVRRPLPELNDDEKQSIREALAQLDYPV